LVLEHNTREIRDVSLLHHGGEHSCSPGMSFLSFALHKIREVDALSTAGDSECRW
jgi:hypothetical protein